MDSYFELLPNEILTELNKFCKGNSYFLNLFSPRISLFAGDGFQFLTEFSSDANYSNIHIIYNTINMIEIAKYERSEEFLKDIPLIEFINAKYKESLELIETKCKHLQIVASSVILLVSGLLSVFLMDLENSKFADVDKLTKNNVDKWIKIITTECVKNLTKQCN